MSVVVVVLLVLTDSLLALVTGVLARVRGRRLWVWAIFGLVVPIVSLVVVVLVPRAGPRPR